MCNMKRHVFVLTVNTSATHYHAEIFATDETEALSLFAETFNPILAARVPSDGKLFIHTHATAACVLKKSQVITHSRMPLALYAQFEKIGG